MTDETGTAPDGGGPAHAAAMLDALPCIALHVAADGTLAWGNARWREAASELGAAAWPDLIAPEDARVAALLAEAIAAGRETQEHLLLRTRGNAVRRCTAATAAAPGGGVLLTFTPVIGESLAEERMRHSEERFRTLVEGAAAVIWMTNAAGELMPPQPRWTAYTGQSEEAYQGWGWVDAVHPDDRANAAEVWAQSVETSSPYHIEYRLLRHDGEWRDTEVRGFPVLRGDGTIREWIGLNVDVTDRKRDEAALREARAAAEAANVAKSQFLANMSHELRTPLSAVIGYAEMLGEELEDVGQADLLPDLRKIESSARHLLGLINDVLDISKIEAGRMTVSAERFEVADLLDDVAAATGSLVGRKRNRFVLDAPDGTGAMEQDQIKIRQCLLNLIGNAAKFTEDGEIGLAVRRGRRPDGDWMTFAVSDTGIGLTEEHQAKLFQRFSQADDTTTRKFGGTGLGLAITRAFCEKMGGSIAVESAFGAGTTFTIALPAILPASDEPEEVPGEIAEVLEALAREPLALQDVVLVVDDDPAARELLQRFLERDGFRVRTANDGRAGLTLAKALKPRAVLLDIQMPRMDGWSVLHAIRQDPELAATPVIMTSVVDERGLGKSLGATDYLVKPIDRSELADAMERFRPEGHPGDALVVDDDPDARSRLRRILSRDGWDVREAENGADALARVDEGRPSVILLDLMMPVMDGFAFLRAYRARPDGDAPVIVLTAKDVSEEEQTVLERQADRLIVKGSVSLAEIGRQLRTLYRTDDMVPMSGRLQSLVDRIAAGQEP